MKNCKIFVWEWNSVAPLNAIVEHCKLFPSCKLFWFSELNLVAAPSKQDAIKFLKEYNEEFEFEEFEIEEYKDQSGTSVWPN